MIGKTIHYCWFGGNPLPKMAKKCLKSWKKFCPDYEIIRWDESNFDISSSPLYVRQAYEAKKWAFVTDYVRLKIVHDHGGIYLDTDVELLKNIDFLLENRAYFGFEADRYINTGIGFGAEKGTDVLKEIMEDYEGIPFVNDNGNMDMTPCPIRNTRVFLRHGLVQNGQTQTLDNNCVILATHILCPVSYYDEKEDFREDTISIHHFSSSWEAKEKQKQRKRRISQERRAVRIDKFKHLPNRILKKILGEKRYEKLKTRVKGK